MTAFPANLLKGVRPVQKERPKMIKSIKFREWEDPLLPTLKSYQRFYKKRLKEAQSKENPDYWKMKNKGVDARPPYSGPTIMGAFGAIPLYEENMPSRLWNFMVGDSNFEITEQVYQAIENTPGVDILRQWSRYRLWIGIGTNFDKQDVIDSIEKNAISASLDIRTSLLKQSLQKYPYWAIYVGKNGTIGELHGDDREEVASRLSGIESQSKEIILSWPTQDSNRTGVPKNLAVTRDSSDLEGPF